MNFGNGFYSEETQRRNDELRRAMLRPFARYPILRWLMAMIGAILFFVGMGKLHDFRHIQEAGIKTQGVLLSIEGAPHNVGTGAYSFTVGNQKYLGENRIGGKDRSGLYPGMKIEVRYLAENPAQSMTNVSWPYTANMFAAAGVLTIFCLMIFLWGIGKARRDGVTL